MELTEKQQRIKGQRRSGKNTCNLAKIKSLKEKMNNNFNFRPFIFKRKTPDAPFYGWWRYYERPSAPYQYYYKFN